VSPFYQEPMVSLYVGHVLDVLKALPERSVQCCVTSPPYWGLRDYQLEPQVWGGEQDCQHTWESEQVPVYSHKGNWQQAENGDGLRTGKSQTRHRGNLDSAREQKDSIVERACCQACRGWKGSLGLEPTPDCLGWATKQPCGQCYVCHIVQVFLEVRRVLREDGSCWINLGDSYTSVDFTRQGNPRNVPQLPNDWAGTELGNRGRAGHAVAVKRDLGHLKPKDLIGLPWRVAFALQADGWTLRSDIIWCLSGGTKVYVRSGNRVTPMTIHDLVRLKPETVQLWNGEKWTQVLGYSRSNGRSGVLEIELRSGERISCTPGHQWPTNRGLLRTDDLQVGDIIETCSLPGPQAPATPAFIPNEVGWFVGLYIAEGSLDSGGTIQIASHTKELSRFDRLCRLAQQYHGTCRMHQTSQNGMTINLDCYVLGAVIEQYVAGRTASDKHLSTIAWQRANGFLFELLRGYLDGDGHLDAPNRRWRLGLTRNYALESDLRTLCARLGLGIRLKLSTTTFDGRSFKTHRGEIRLHRSAHHNNKPDSEIVAIHPSKGRSFWDIGVADEPHTFALASGVLTHNSKPNPMPESVTDRPTKSHEYLFLLTKQERYYYDADAIREPGEFRDYGPEKIKRERNVGGRTDGYTTTNGGYGLGSTGTRNKRSVWTIATQPYPEAHFATFPQALIEPCIQAGSSEKGCCASCSAPWTRVVKRSSVNCSNAAKAGTSIIGKGHVSTQVRNGHDVRNGPTSHTSTIGWQATCTHDAPVVPCTVLDPFAGSGTTLFVARELQRQSIGIDLSEAYARLAMKRLRQQELPFAMPMEIPADD
jgi:DNA modification methylase